MSANPQHLLANRMSIRALWLITKNESCVVLSRRFPTVEVRAKTIFSSRTVPAHLRELPPYDPIPCDAEFFDAFKCQIMDRDHERDCIACKLETPQGILWPLVIVDQPAFYLAAVPLIETPLTLFTSNVDPSLAVTTSSICYMPEITSTTTVLLTLSSFAAAGVPSFSDSQIAELQLYITAIMPFGRPLDTREESIRSLRRTGFPPAEVLTQKRPAWKPHLFRGKQKLEFLIREEISAAQYDKEAEGVKDTYDCHGVIHCRADLENIPEVTVTLAATAVPASSAAAPPTTAAGGKKPRKIGGELADISVDACVATGDFVKGMSSSASSHSSFSSLASFGSGGGGSASSTTLAAAGKLSFTPPLGQFALCRYAVKALPQLPLRGFYQMKEVGQNAVKLLVQLKLSEHVKNEFSHCVVHVPFFGRGRIVSLEKSPTAGTVAIDSDGRTLVWNIGQKFTGRNLEVALPAKVVFDGVKEPLPSEEDDPFLRGHNCYVKLDFRIVDDTLSGLDIDQRTLVIFPNTKAQVIVEREIVSGDYKIWNSLGKPKWAIAPPS